MFTTILYSLKKAPIVPANSPSALNTTVKPSTKLSALKKTLCFFIRSSCKIWDIQWQKRQHTGGNGGNKAFQKGNHNLHVGLLCLSVKEGQKISVSLSFHFFTGETKRSAAMLIQQRTPFGESGSPSNTWPRRESPVRLRTIVQRIPWLSSCS